MWSARKMGLGNSEHAGFVGWVLRNLGIAGVDWIHLAPYRNMQ